LLALLLAPAGCHNTAQGIKTDTNRALEKTGEGIEKVGRKLAGHGERDAG
jgi:hypothetical protein